MVMHFASYSSYRVNHVVHQLVNFSPLEPRLPAVPHDFGVGAYNIKNQNGEGQQ